MELRTDWFLRKMGLHLLEVNSSCFAGFVFPLTQFHASFGSYLLVKSCKTVHIGRCALPLWFDKHFQPDVCIIYFQELFLFYFTNAKWMFMPSRGTQLRPWKQFLCKWAELISLFIIETVRSNFLRMSLRGDAVYISCAEAQKTWQRHFGWLSFMLRSSRK